MEVGSRELVPARAIIYLPSLWSLIDTSPQAAAATWLLRPACEYQNSGVPPLSRHCRAPRCCRRTPFRVPPSLPASHALFLPAACGGDDFCGFLGCPEMLPLLPVERRRWVLRRSAGIRGSALVLGALRIFLLALSASFSPSSGSRDAFCAHSCPLGQPLASPWQELAKSGACGGCRGLPHPQFGLLDPMPQEIVTWGGGFPLCGQNVRGTEIPNARPSLLCPAETGRRAAAFPALHNFHFNGFSSFFFFLAVCQLPFFIVN